ncbi:MAG: hypothetical protein G01um101444_440 [Parcubacteria group bacterium Gr01-1014_44]|nr:MAG: hypothetical protein G01um101444_440 [Parcubacteria group bacterium Gr01-1014_44]
MSLLNVAFGDAAGCGLHGWLEYNILSLQPNP